MKVLINDSQFVAGKYDFLSNVLGSIDLTFGIEDDVYAKSNGTRQSVRFLDLLLMT